MKRVCLTGAESTGKTVLAPRIAARFGGVMVEEFGRLYAEANGIEFTPDDLRRIAAGHVDLRVAAEVSRPKLIVEDTDIVTTAVWAEMLFGEPDPALEAMPASADLYLLFAPDVPWIDDGTRMFGTAERRARFHGRLEDQFARRGIRPVQIGGDWETRYEGAVAAIENRLGI